MNIGIIDAEIIGKKKHRFPNLACMKIASYNIKKGNNVKLIMSYDDICNYDLVYISKVFTDTFVPEYALKFENVMYGGTGFYYDKATPLPYEIEHSKPYYDLYKDWVYENIENGINKKEFKYYLDYSIGFLTRGCFRQCAFCVNKNYTKCNKHSPIEEFIDTNRPKLCFLDDNFFACSEWRQIIDSIKNTKKGFQFKQGLDERLLNEEKIHELMSWKYDGDFIFAFDNIEDSETIQSKLDLFKALYPKSKRKNKFYVFCGFDINGVYDEDFWIKDLENLFKRIFILAKYGALPYVMRFEKTHSSSHKKIYNAIAGWCNQPSIFRKFSFAMFCRCHGMGKLYTKMIS